MSSSQRRVEAGLETINRVPGRGWPDVGLQAVTPHDIDAGIEQSGDIVLDGDVFVDPDPGHRIDLDHDIDVAVGTRLVPRARTEQRRTPRSRSAISFPRNRVTMSLRSMRLYVTWKAFPARHGCPRN
jgi:hypothetical protein